MEKASKFHLPKKLQNNTDVFGGVQETLFTP